MKKNFKYFGIVWLVCFALFNAVTFLIPAEIMGINRYEQPVFWVSYALIVVCFLGQLFIAWKFTDNETGEKVFLGIPLLTTGYAAVIVSLIVGAVFMVVPVIPAWIGAIVCLVVLVYFILAAVKAHAAAEAVEAVGEKVKAQTSFIRMAIVDAEMLVQRATTEEIKAEARKAYEALRYSDPMSVPALAGVEAELSKKLEDLKRAVADSNAEAVTAYAAELVLLAQERNAKCKMLK